MDYQQTVVAGPFPTRAIVQRQCFVCGRVRCLLRSHEVFTRRMFSQGVRSGSPHQIDDQKPDPFATHPIPMNADLERLYAHSWLRWNSDFKGAERHLFPYPISTTILRFGWHDKALHYAVLSVIATQLSLLQTGTVDKLALNLQIQTLAAQREALTQEESLDARILTAICILATSYANNTSEDLSSHVHLITGWVQKRGGLHYTGFDGIVAHALMYDDFTPAITNNRPLRYPVTLPAIASTVAPEAGPHYDQLSMAGALSHEVTAAANNYVIMVKIIEKVTRNEASPSEGTYFSYLTSVLEYQLACANALYRDTNTLEECIILACTLGDIVVFRNCGQIQRIAWTVEDRLWRCLEQIKEMNIFRAPHLRRLEWYLTCAAGITAVNGKCKYEPNVIKELVRFRCDPYQPLKDFEELCCTMDDYGWCKVPSLPLFSRLWNESSHLLFNPVNRRELVYRVPKAVDLGNMY